jgi:hypothetical protein
MTSMTFRKAGFALALPIAPGYQLVATWFCQWLATTPHAVCA